MFDLRGAPVARVLVPFAGGSLAGTMDIYPYEPVTVIITCILLWTGLLLADRLFRGRPGIHSGIFTALAFGLFFLTGLGTGILDKPEDPELPLDERIMISGTILEVPLERNGRLEYEMGLGMVLTCDTVYPARSLLKVYMQMPLDSLVPVAGELWRMGGRLVAIGNNGNPGEIDYATILKRKNCWYRFYCDTVPGLNSRMTEPRSWRYSAVRIRSVLSRQWDGPPEAVSLLKAVCLGDRSGLSESLRQSYSRAGGMHVLAVSGLHVGLIWWVLHRAFSFLVRLLRREIYRAALIIVLLWSYAFITGFSSSVCRSVTMFSFLSAARLIYHRGHPVNTILVSMFFLILIHPGRLMEVGFQLSYAAVLAIVTLYPALRKLVRVKNRALKWIWEATAVSLSAQAGTLPFVVVYFHQVPVYALVTNLVAIPLLSCIITLFVLTVPLTAIGTGAGAIYRLLVFLGGLMNSAMELVASIPGCLIGGLFMDPVCAVLLVVLLFSGIALLSCKSGFPVYFFIFILCLLLCQSARACHKRISTSQLVVGHFFNGSMVTFREGIFVDHYIWCKDPEQVAYMDRYLASAWGSRSYEVSVIRVGPMDRSGSFSGEAASRVYHGGISTCIPLYPGTWVVGNRKHRGLVVTGSMEVEQLEILTALNPGFFLFSGEPPLSTELMENMDTIATEIIADGSNRTWYTERMDDFTGQIHFTGERGAFLVQD